MAQTQSLLDPEFGKKFLRFALTIVELLTLRAMTAILLMFVLFSGFLTFAQDLPLRTIAPTSIAVIAEPPSRKASAEPSSPYNVLYNFGSHSQDGVNPQAGLVLANDGNLYGTTVRGGAYNNGTVFQFNPTTLSETIIHSFSGGTDGNQPLGTLIQATDGNLYGTVLYSGGNCPAGGNGGEVFRIGTGTAGQNFAVIHCFNAPTEGDEPYSGVIQGSDGYLYGTTFQSGPNGSGTAFQMNLSGTVLAVHGFAGSPNDGANPNSAFMEANGTFYNTTYTGGTANQGTIFSMDSSMNVTILHSITSSDGISEPYEAPLYLGTNGNLYGEAYDAAYTGYGGVFSIDTNGQNFSVIHLFQGPDGANPLGGLIQVGGGSFFGTAQGAGGGQGDVFMMNSAGTLSPIHSFTGSPSDGSQPMSGVIYGNGNLYGTTYAGGTQNDGIIFRLAVYTLTVSDVGQGTVTSADGMINCVGTANGTTGNCSATYPSSTQVTLTATAASGSAFQGWSGACSGTGSCMLTMSQNLSTTATFTLPTYSLAVNDVGQGLVTSTDGQISCARNANGSGGTCSVNYPSGMTVTLNASPLPGWTFVNWSGTGCSGTNPSCAVLMNSSQNPSANFVAEDITLSKTTITFQKTIVGTTSAATSVTIKNTGTSAQPVAMVMSGDFTETNNCSGNIASGGSCAVSLFFAPTIAGSVSGAASIYDNYGTLLAFVGLKGTGELPVTTTPTSLTFTGETIGTLSAPQTFNITNNSAATVAISDITASTDYVLNTGTCLTTSLAAGASCTVSVQVQPTSAKDNGAVIITDNASGAQPLVVKLTTTASGGSTDPISLNKSSLTFTEVNGGTSAAQTVTVTNKSSADVAMGTISASSDYAIVNNTCPPSLAVEEKCTFGVTFNPTFVGIIEGSVAVAYTGNNSPQVVGLTGTSLASLTISPSKLTFASQAQGTTSAGQAVTVTNNTANPVTLDSIETSGDFSIQPASTSCSLTGGTLAANATCVIEIQFAPSKSGTVTGSVTLTNNSSLNPLLIPLSGTGTAAVPSFTLSALPSSLSVSQGGSGTSTITINATDGFTGSVSLSATGLPNGVTAAFNPTSATVTSILTLSASETATPGGPTTLTITGTSGTITQTATISLSILSYQTATTAADGTVSFSGPSLTVTVSDIASQLPLAGINVTMIGQGTQYGLVLVDPAKQYTPRIFFIQDSSGNPVLPQQSSNLSVFLAPLLNGITEVSACIAGIATDGLLIPSQCAALTSAMWQFVEQNLMTCSQTTLANIGQQLLTELQGDLVANEEENAAMVTGSLIALALPPGPDAVALGVLGVADIAITATGATSDTALAFSEAQVAAYEEMGYSLQDPFVACSVNRAIPGIDLILDDLTTLHPLNTITTSSPPSSGMVSGTVSDAVTAQPVPGAQVLLYGACASTLSTNPSITAANGTYSFANVATGGSCNVSVTDSGYVQAGELNLVVNPYMSTTANFSLLRPGMFVANAPSTGPYSVTEYSISANGNASPVTTIQGANTGLNVPSGVAIDNNGDTWVTNYAVGGTPSVTEYAPGSNGNSSPIATISGSLTNLVQPKGLAIDSLGNIWVANSGSVVEFAAGSNGNVAPVAFISGSNTGLNTPGTVGGITVDSDGNLWVTIGQGGPPTSIAEFVAGSNGNVSPALTISGSNTGLNYPAGIAIEANGTIWVANQSLNAPSCPGATGSITEYEPGSSGDATPIATISGTSTALSNPYGLAIYPNGDVWVVNACNGSVTEYAPNSNGNVTPIAVISGSNTGLNAPGGTAGMFPSAVP